MSIFGGAKEEKGPLKTIKVMMLGGQRTGKTTVLNSMYRNFDDIFGGSTLLQSPSDSKTLLKLDEKENEIASYYTKSEITIVPDDNPTEGYNRYGFDIRIRGKDDFVRLEFYDFKGEWLKNTDHIEDLGEEISQSEVFMIVIDTPYMMERGDVGENYNQGRNNCDLIYQLLKKYINESGPKTVLFVPLKCEKYRSDGRMKEVCDEIKSNDCYGKLIKHLAGAKSEVAITPIFTMGTLEFHKFKRDDVYEDSDGSVHGGKIITDHNYGPKYPEYIKTGQKHEPKYCEQPLLYGLCHALFIATVFKKNEEENRSFWGKIWDAFKKRFFDSYKRLSESRDFGIAMLKLVPMIIKQLDEGREYGYEIIQDEFGYKRYHG